MSEYDNQAFDALIDEFYPVWFRYHPEVAIDLGIDGFESCLPASDDDDLGALGIWLENLLVALGEIGERGLDAARRLDYRLLLEAAQVEYFELLARDWRHLDPTRFLPIQEIFLLTLHPPRELRASLLRVLQAVPGYLRQARTQIADFPESLAPEMVRVAIQDGDAGVAYLQTLSSGFWLRHHCSGSGSSEVQAACDDAIAAIQTYADTLRQEIAPRARGRLGCGEEHLQRLMGHRHAIDLPLERVRTYLEALYLDTFRALEVPAQTLGIPGEPAFALAWIAQQEAFSGERRLQVYREEANRLRDFVRQTGLLTFPEVPFRIVERPACPRPGHCESGYLQEPGRRGGLFFIAGRVGEETHFGEPRAVIRCECMGQAWTGAHLLAFAGGAHARDLPRRVAPAAAFAGAWGLYVRRLLMDLGFGDVADRLVQLVHRLRALRLAILDIDLNLHRVTGSEALAQIGELEPDADRALYRLVNLARAPGDALASAVGWALLHQTRDLLQADDAGFLLADFHDTLMSQGAVPPALLIPHLYGETLWARVKDELTP
jgi:hypothetical protein